MAGITGAAVVWAAVGQRPGEFPTERVLDYAAAVDSDGKSVAALLERERHEVHRLGLLQSRTLQGSSGPAAARSALRRNLDMVSKLGRLKPAERDRLAAMTEDGSEPERKIASAILQFSVTSDYADLAGLSVEDVQGALRWRPPEVGASPEGPEPLGRGGGDAEDEVRPEWREGDAVALELMLEADGRGLKTAARRFKDALIPDDEGTIDADEVKVGHDYVSVRKKVGTTESVSLFGQLLTEDCWGGVVESDDGVDFISALKAAAKEDVEVKRFTPAVEPGLRWILQRAIDTGSAPTTALERWDEYAARRARLLPAINALIDHPLMAIAGDDRLAADVDGLVSAYGDAMTALLDTANALLDRSPEPARRLLAQAVCLDVVFFSATGELTAIAAPIHPFHLWRWAAFAQMLREHHDELTEIGRDVLEPLIANPLAIAPHLVLSPYASEALPLNHARPLIAVGSFGALPQFAEPTTRQLAKFRARPLQRLAERFLALMPHAGLGMRVAFIDPPSIAGALEDLLQAKSPLDDEARLSIHATVLRTRPEIAETEEEEEHVARLSHELSEAGGSLTVLPAERSLARVAEHIADQPHHLTVVFDPGSGQRYAVGVAQPPPLSPLTVPRRYHYDPIDDRLDVVLAGEAAPFSAYHDIFCRTMDIPRSDFIGRRSGASLCRRDLERIAQGSIWTVVVDQGVERTLRLRGTQRLDWRSDGGRDLVTFSAFPETVEELVRDAVRVAGLTPDEETVKQVLTQLFSLSGEAVLNLAKVKPGLSLAEPRVSKGIIGVLAAVRWYQARHPGALVISLDEKESRRWVLGHNADDRHGDLLALRLTAAGVTVEAIEVKSHDDEDGGVRERKGVLQGKAVTQVDQTLATLRAILDVGSTSPVARARRDVLCDHVYRTIASRDYDVSERQRLVSLAEALLQDGPSELTGLVFTVTIAPGEDAISPSEPKLFKSPAGNVVGLVQLRERGASAMAEQRYPLLSSSPKTGSSRASEGAVTSAWGRGASRRETKTTVETSAPTPSRNATPTEMSILVGHAPGGSAVTWEPNQSERPLNNFGLMVTGDSGAGKTQFLRALIAETAALGLPVCVFDYKNDYATAEFSEPAQLRVYSVDRDGLPFNPLSLVPDHRGEAQPIRQIHELAGILRRIFRLGDQQEAQLKRAMSAAYEALGIKPRTRHRVTPELTAPSFSDVVAILGSSSKSEALLNRLSPLFDLGLFPEQDDAKTSFEAMLQDRVVLELHGLDDERIKAAISEFIIVRLHGYVLKGEQPRALRRLLVFDEAWRVKHSQRLQELAREGRAFGVGIAVSTQFPDDLPESLTGNLATHLLLYNQSVEHRRAVVRTLCGATTGPAAKQLNKQLGQLQKHEGFFRNQQYQPYTLVETLPHYKRELAAARASPTKKKRRRSR